MKNHDDEVVLKRERTTEFFEAAQVLSDFVAGIDLSVKQNNTLVRLVCDQVEAAETGAFAQGFKMGVAYKEDEMEDRAMLLDGEGGIPS